jgi:hypothetical protein
MELSKMLEKRWNKDFELFTNQDKAMLLWNLFKDGEIVKCFEYQCRCYQDIVNKREDIMAKWPGNNIMSPAMYVGLAEQLAGMIDRQIRADVVYPQNPFLKDPAGYAELFENHLAVVSNHAVQYWAMHEASSLKFRAAVALLYDFDPLRIRVERYKKDLETAAKEGRGVGAISVAAAEWLVYSAGELECILLNVQTQTETENKKQ